MADLMGLINRSCNIYLNIGGYFQMEYNKQNFNKEVRIKAATTLILAE